METDKTKKQSAKLKKLLGGRRIRKELRQQILPHADNDSLVVVNSTVAVVRTSRSEWGSTGGIGYWDQIRVFCRDKTAMEEWQWRDRYSADFDRHDLKIHSIGKIRVYGDKNCDGGAYVLIEVELINREGGWQRVAEFSFSFDPAKPVAPRTLPPEKQAIFIAQAEREVARVMKGLKELWRCKSKMVNPLARSTTDRLMSYQRPSIKQQEFRPEIGVAAFVTEEQIDHRLGDPQIRHELYVLTAGSEKAKCVAEDHGYDREGGAFLTILEVNPKSIVINTKKGKKTISLKP